MQSYTQSKLNQRSCISSHIFLPAEYKTARAGVESHFAFVFYAQLKSFL